MPTNPLPKGSANVCANVPVEVRSALGRLAYSRGQYVGQLLRELIRGELIDSTARGELAVDLSVKALAALDRSMKLLVVAGLLGITVNVGLPAAGTRGVRRPSQQIVRTARAARKLGESFFPWEGVVA